MNKILAVARAEYFIAATSKAFILGIVMMPVFAGGALLVQYLARDQVDTTARKIAIADYTGRMFESLETQANQRNEQEIYSQEPGSERQQTAAEFELESVEPNRDNVDDLNVELSERVESGDLFAFAIIEQGVYEPDSSDMVRYHSQTPTYSALPNWLRRAVNGEVKRDRTEKMGLSPESLQALAQQTPVKTFGLVTLNEEGKVEDAKEENQILVRIVPFAGLMLMFMMIMSVAPAMLNNVLEEKMQKISEFLVSSVTPFQLMMGKLTGAVGIGMTLSTIYLGAAYGLTHYFEIADQIPVALYAWFVFFLFIALVILCRQSCALPRVDLQFAGPGHGRSECFRFPGSCWHEPTIASRPTSCSASLPAELPAIRHHHVRPRRCSGQVRGTGQKDSSAFAESLPIPP